MVLQNYTLHFFKLSVTETLFKKNTVLKKFTCKSRVLFGSNFIQLGCWDKTKKKCLCKMTVKCLKKLLKRKYIYGNSWNIQDKVVKMQNNSINNKTATSNPFIAQTL